MGGIKHSRDSLDVGGSRASKKRSRAKAKKQKQQNPNNNNITVTNPKQTPLEEDRKRVEEKKDPLVDTTSTPSTTKNNHDGDDKDVNKEEDHNDDIDDSKLKKENDGKKVGFASDTNFEVKGEPCIVNEILTELTPTLHDIVFPPTTISMNNNNNDNNTNSANEHNEDNEEEHPISSLSTEERAKLLLASILHPTVTIEEFYAEYWEKKPLLITAASQKKGDNGSSSQLFQKRLNGLLSKDDVETLLSTQSLRYGKDLNVTNFVRPGSSSSSSQERRRITLDLLPHNNNSNTEGDDYIVADAKDVWANFDAPSNCTIRLLCPQKYVDSIHSMLSLMEHEFGCMVGANAYLTPPCSSQGFAPHYDDIEAFVLQLEGTKCWKVYAPSSNTETLPRSSSKDFTLADMKTQHSSPVLDVTLQLGDVLYMPRGWVHQAHTPSATIRSKQHSLHLTVSAMQSWSWIDMMENLMPQALHTCANESLSLREGLPNKFLDYMGIMHTIENENKVLTKEEQFYEDPDIKQKRKKREHFKEEAKRRIMRVCKEAISMIDDGCDMMAERFLSDRLPPALTDTERSLTNDAPTNTNSDGNSNNNNRDVGLSRHILPNTLCRLVRPGIARLMVEDDGGNSSNSESQPQRAVVYHCNDNAREYQGNPLSPMEFEVDDALALETLLTTTEPQWVRVCDLTHDSGTMEDKVGIVQALYDEGILSIWNPPMMMGEGAGDERILEE